jgi:hypothetical protein
MENLERIPLEEKLETVGLMLGMVPLCDADALVQLKSDMTEIIKSL